MLAEKYNFEDDKSYISGKDNYLIVKQIAEFNSGATGQIQERRDHPRYQT